MSNPYIKCSYFGCDEFVCKEDLNIQQGMKFCQSHHDQLEKIIEEENPKKIIGFWIKANGGAKRLAETV